MNYDPQNIHAIINENVDSSRIDLTDGLEIDEVLSALNVEKTIRWLLFVAIIVSAAFYLLRQFVKLGMSSMHLSHDAAERREHSFLHLALMKNSDDASKEERIIILQSLFSQSETGLLKHDAGPTLPGLGMIDGIANKNKTE